jgi:predicted HAD superfamily Cof-like phosphohydrolase
LEELVKEFQKKYGHFMSDVPTLNIPQSAKMLRVKLIKEEVGETLFAMGFNGLKGKDDIFYEVDEDLIEIADGIADSLYVLIGAAHAYGIPITRIFTEVHRSNMTKDPIKATGDKKYGTKTPKGPSYIPPDIKGIIEYPEKQTVLESLADGYATNDGNTLYY